MSDFLRMADKIGNHLASAGLALETVARLLSRDGIDHNFSPEDTWGLIHAIHALGGSVRDAGYDLCEAVELEAADARESQEVRHA